MRLLHRKLQWLYRVTWGYIGFYGLILGVIGLYRVPEYDGPDSSTVKINGVSQRLVALVLFGWVWKWDPKPNPKP